VIAPGIVAIAIAVFALVPRATRGPALGSLAAAAAITAGLALRGGGPYTALALATTVLLFYTHRSNLAKLRRR
jgi:hypothetical protein